MLFNFAACVAFGLAVLGAAAVPDKTPRQRMPEPLRRGALAQGQNVPADCTFFDKIQSPGEDCDYIAAMWMISTEDFIAWNPDVGEDCSGIQVGVEYCVERNYGHPITSSTTSQASLPTSSTTTSTITSTTSSKTAGPTSTAPSPTQSGMVDGCTKYYQAVDGDDCSKIVASHGTFSLSDFIAWNPAVGSGCSGLWSGYWYCIAIEGTPTKPPTPSSTTSTGNGIQTPAPTQPGMVDNCNKFHLIKSTTTCQGIADYNKVSLSDIFKWNTGINKDCSNLWLGTYACVGVIGGEISSTAPPPTTTTSKPGNGIATPTPTQAGMVSNCNKFHLVKSTTTCQGMADYNKVSVANILKWNTGLKSDCSNLWLDTYACVGVVGGGSAPPPTTTKPAGNGVATPTPTQPGMVGNCNKFHLVKSTTTCQGMADYNHVSLANIKKWNTGINAACSNLWLGTYACVGVL